MNNPMDAAAQERVKACAAEVMNRFSEEYPSCYKTSLVKSIKANQPTDGPPPYQLVDPPPMDQVLKEGWMLKLGGVRKNWKKRWFVAHNEDQNFVVRYYEKQGGKIKGEISLCGYATRGFDEEELKKLKGEDGIACVKSGVSTARVWKLRMPPSDVDEWKAALDTCAKKAKPPIGLTNKIGGEAFLSAYNNTRYGLGVWGAPRSPTGNEQEALATMIHSRMESIHEDITSKIPDNAMKNTVLGAVDKTIGGIVGVAVEAGWKASSAAMEAVTAPLTAGIEGALAPLQTAEAALNETVTGMCDAFIAPAMAKGVEALGPLIEMLTAPVSAGYVQAATLWSELAKQVRDEANKDASGLQSALRGAYWSCWSRGFSTIEPLKDALRALKGFDDFPLWEIYDQLYNQLFILTRKGLATMAQAIEGGATPDEAYASTLAKVLNDTKLFVVDTMKAILSGIIKPKFESEVKPLCLEPTAPLDEQIPGPVKEFVTVAGIVENLLDNVLDTAISAVVLPLAGPAHEKIDAAAADLA